jgi:hypothetical protein
MIAASGCKEGDISRHRLRRVGGGSDVWSTDEEVQLGGCAWLAAPTPQRFGRQPKCREARDVLTPASATHHLALPHTSAQTQTHLGHTQRIELSLFPSHTPMSGSQTESEDGVDPFLVACGLPSPPAAALTTIRPTDQRRGRFCACLRPS